LLVSGLGCRGRWLGRTGAGWDLSLLLAARQEVEEELEEEGCGWWW